MRIALACCGLLVAVCAEPATAQGDFRHPHLRPPGKVAVALKRVQARPLQRTASAFSGPVLNSGASEVTPARSVPPWHWRVLRTAWTDADEKAYGEFVRRIGESKCRRVHECLADAQSNPLYSESNPPGMRFTSDCADLPYMLRAYFAWKNGLPFSYSAAVSPLGQSDDIRYTEGGNVAVKARIHLRPQPARLPDNIYGTTGDWETYSTPSRDARLRSSFKDLRDEVARFLGMAATGSPRLNYTGHDIRRDLREVYLQETSACTFTYTRSNGAHKQLSLADLQRRLFRLSFDPHHCVERRWGADDAEEVASCADAADKADWYAAEQRLRNQIDRAYFVEMSFTLPDLRRKVPGSGLDAPPDTDVMALLGE